MMLETLIDLAQDRDEWQAYVRAVPGSLKASYVVCHLIFQNDRFCDLISSKS